MRVLVVGAGIGGLTLATALARRGIQVSVLERAPELGFVGAGITMQANAMRALATLDLAEEVRRAGEVATTSRLLASDGRVLSEMPFDGIEKALGAPIVCLHRARLQAALLARAGADTVKLGKPVRRYVETPDGVTAELEDGTSEAGDLLIGADGLRSVVRRVLRGEELLTYAGYTSWRGVSRAADVTPPGMISESWGVGARFGIVPIGQGEIYWFAVLDAPAGGQDDPKHRELFSRFEGWHDPIPRLLESTPVESIIRTDIYDRPPIDRWSKGKVALLGDAAHPMTPNLGQGGCQAIEDAVVLAACLAQEPSEAAFAAYERARVRRANGIVLQARAFGKWGQWSNPVARAVRDTMVRLTPRSILSKQMIDIMGFVPPSA